MADIGCQYVTNSTVDEGWETTTSWSRADLILLLIGIYHVAALGYTAFF